MTDLAVVVHDWTSLNVVAVMLWVMWVEYRRLREGWR